MPLHPLTNFEIQKYENEPKCNDLYSINNLSKIKDGTYIISLDEYELIETHWIALYVNAKNLIYFQNSLDIKIYEYKNLYEKNDKIILKYFQ